MKVFISWSKDLSHQVAKIFQRWLPSVIQAVEPFVSSVSIAKGARGYEEIARELEESNFGILCVTSANKNAPWLMFEAGALSKQMGNARVCPFLYNISRSNIDGPLAQCQSTVFEKEDLFQLVSTVNEACASQKLSDYRLRETIEVWYPRLEKDLRALESGNAKAEDGRNTEKAVTELSADVRGQQITGGSVREFYLHVFERLEQLGIDYQPLIPFQYGRKRYLINTQAVHSDGGDFNNAVRYGDYYIEVNVNRPMANRVMKKFLKAVEAL